MPTLRRVISGGQTGVDRAALDAAMGLGIPCGGWCPRGRRAEDGHVPERYPLEETPSAAYTERTRRNVEEAAATLVLTRGAPRGGTALTVRLAHSAGRPVKVVDLDARVDEGALRGWIRSLGAVTLNVAGPRESHAPGIGAEARDVLERVLG